jgi:hypothetical protein
MKEKTIEKRYEGYFLMDSGVKVFFDISEEDGDTKFKLLYDEAKFSWEREDTIWLGEDSELRVLANKVIGYYISEYDLIQ